MNLDCLRDRGPFGCGAKTETLLLLVMGASAPEAVLWLAAQPGPANSAIPALEPNRQLTYQPDHLVGFGHYRGWLRNPD